MVKTEQALQKMLDRLVATIEEYEIEIYAEKTKVIIISKDEEPLRIIVNNRELINAFQFLYSILEVFSTGMPIALRKSGKGLLWRRLLSIRRELSSQQNWTCS